MKTIISAINSVMKLFNYVIVVCIDTDTHKWKRAYIDLYSNHKAK